HLIQHDQLGHFDIGPGGQQFGGCRNHRIFLRCRTEIVQRALSDLVAAGDPHHIVRVLFHHVLVQLGQHIPHTQSGILGGAEHDGADHPVGALEVSGDLLGYFADTVHYDDVVVVVAVGIDAVGDLIAVDVQLPLLGPPALPNVGHDVDDLERRKKAVLDAFFQTVGIDRLAKIAEVGDVLGFLGGGGHADLHSIRKIFQHPPPAALLLARSSVTLVYDDQV